MTESPTGSAERMKIMKSIAIIGLGGISAIHINSILTEDLGKIVAVCDIKEEKIDKAKKSIPYEVQSFTDWKQMLSSVKAEVVHICTPHYLHAEMAIGAMEAGADVYLEKPAAMNYDEGLKILEVQKKTGRLVCVSFQNRIIPTSVEVKRVVSSNELGGLLGIRAFMTWHRTGSYYTQSDWRGKWATEGGGVLMNQSIHTLDLVNYFGGEVEKTEGTASLRNNKGIIEVEDTAEATLYHKNGGVSVFYATNDNALDSSVFMELYFEKGRLMIQNDMLYRNDGDGYKLVIDGVNEVFPGKKVWGTGHSIMIRNFYNCIDGAKDYYCTLSEGIEILKVIGDIYSCGEKTIVKKETP